MTDCFQLFRTNSETIIKNITTGSPAIGALSVTVPFAKTFGGHGDVTWSSYVGEPALAGKDAILKQYIPKTPGPVGTHLPTPS